MPFYVCLVPVCPVRVEASHRSEQVTQLLFGEMCEGVEVKDFIRIKVLYDGYDGWCQAAQLEEISEQQISSTTNKLAGEWVNLVTVNDQPMYIPFGSSLPNENEAIFGKSKVVYKGSIIEPAANAYNEDSIRKLSLIFINTAYSWGGRSVFGIDCSGFTQLVFKCMNVKLLRDASQQATQGDAIGFLQEVKPGDLAFFDNAEGRISHVGILLNAETIIHASGKVRIDTIDNLGIVNKDTGKRTHKLRIIKRVEV